MISSLRMSLEVTSVICSSIPFMRLDVTRSTPLHIMGNLVLLPSSLNRFALGVHPLLLRSHLPGNTFVMLLHLAHAMWIMHYTIVLTLTMIVSLLVNSAKKCAKVYTIIIVIFPITLLLQKELAFCVKFLYRSSCGRGFMDLGVAIDLSSAGASSGGAKKAKVEGAGGATATADLEEK